MENLGESEADASETPMRIPMERTISTRFANAADLGGGGRRAVFLSSEPSFFEGRCLTFWIFGPESSIDARCEGSQVQNDEMLICHYVLQCLVRICLIAKSKPILTKHCKTQ